MIIVAKAIILCGIILMVYNTSQCFRYFTVNKDLITDFDAIGKAKLYCVYAVCLIVLAGYVHAMITGGDSLSRSITVLISALFFTVVINWTFDTINSVKSRTLDISETLIGVIEAGDANLDGHSILVMDLTMLMYNYLPNEYQKAIKPENLRYAALLLDVGKLGIPSKVLNKPGKLESDEWDIMKRHPEIGVKVLSPIKSFSPILNWIMYHHERMDGNGYYKVSGKDIPLASRIIAVADTYAAIVMVRSYKPSRSYDDAVSTLKIAAGAQLDEEMVNIFCSIPREKVEGCTKEVIEKMKLFLDEDFREED